MENVAAATMPSFLNAEMIEQWKEAFEQGFQMLYFRGAQAEEDWQYQPTGPTSARLVFTGPLPSYDFRGMAENFCKRFQKNTNVRLDDAYSDAYGTTTLLVSW